MSRAPAAGMNNHSPGKSPPPVSFRCGSSTSQPAYTSLVMEEEDNKDIPSSQTQPLVTNNTQQTDTGGCALAYIVCCKLEDLVNLFGWSLNTLLSKNKLKQVLPCYIWSERSSCIE